MQSMVASDIRDDEPIMGGNLVGLLYSIFMHVFLWAEFIAADLMTPLVVLGCWIVGFGTVRPRHVASFGIASRPG